MHVISCRVKIELTKDTLNNLNQYRFSNCAIKQHLIDGIYSLIRRGYRHFVVDIDCPADYWVVELIYAIALANKDLSIYYSVGLYSEEDDSFYDWMFAEPLCQFVLSSAYRVYYRVKGWYERKYHLVHFDFRPIS